MFETSGMRNKLNWIKNEMDYTDKFQSLVAEFLDDLIWELESVRTCSCDCN